MSWPLDHLWVRMGLSWLYHRIHGRIMLPIVPLRGWCRTSLERGISGTIVRIRWPRRTTLIATRIYVSRGVRPCLRIPHHIHIRTGPLRVALHHIRREKLPRQRIIVPRVEVIKPRHAVRLLASEANAGGQRATAGARVAVGPVEQFAWGRTTAVTQKSLSPCVSVRS